jgi:hypothetical protein
MSSRQHRFCRTCHVHRVQRLAFSPVTTFLLAVGALVFLAQDGPRAEPPPIPAAPRVEPQPTPVAPPALVAPVPVPFTGSGATMAVPVAPAPPAPTKPRQAGAPVLVENLSQVPEVELDPNLHKNAAGFQHGQHITALIGQIKTGNGKKTDGFLEDVLGKRRDLNGLPVAMGDACRLKGERSREFPVAVALVRDSMRRSAGDKQNPRKLAEQDRATEFWNEFRHATSSAREGKDQQHACGARVAALMQVLGPESAALRLGLVGYLKEVADSDAAKALARLAIFSEESEVRQAAVKALQARSEGSDNDVLLAGLRYPLPAVADRAATAVVQLQRKGLVPQLVDLLDAPDPRAPVITEVNKKKVPVIREVVRVNHNRNCLLCHSPGTTSEQFFGLGLITAPIPSNPPDSPSDGYRNDPSFPDNLVRIDVTYLRQDFSMMQAVKDSQPWPGMQRFDFLVRTRQLTEAEAKAFGEKLAKSQAGPLSPYQRATLTALRELTGKDTEPKAEAWRRLLDLPANARAN